MSKRRSIFFRYFICFITGWIFAYAVSGTKVVLDFLFVGDQIQCQTSFPRYHSACLYSRFGIGEQSLSFQVDGKTVYSVNDFAGGNLKERISWDEQGHKVSLEVLGRKLFLYDANLEIEIKD